MITPTKIPEAYKINELNPDHIVARLVDVEYFMGQLPPGTPPVKAGQVLTAHAHEQLMQEIRSGTFVQYGISHGQGALEWYSLAEMGYTTLKSMLVILARPTNNIQLREKLKQIPVQISEKVLNTL